MKRKSSASAEVVPEPAAPAPEGFVRLATGRVVPIVVSAAGRVSPLAHTAADRVNAAAVLVSPYAVTAAGRLVPLAQTAAGRLTPLAQSAVQAAGKVGPLAATARQRGTEVAQSAVGNLSPRLDEALGRVSPTVEAARGKVTDDYLPRLGEAITSAAGAPAVVEATKRSKAAMAAVRGEHYLPEPVLAPQSKPRSALAARSRQGARLLGGVALVAGVAGGVALLIKQLLGDKDADWQAARPTTPYTPTTPASAKPASQTATTDSTTSNQSAGSTPNHSEAAASADSQWGETGHVLADSGDVDAVENTGGSGLSGEPAHRSGGHDTDTEGVFNSEGQVVWDEALHSGPRYSGEGVYVGAEPPEGYAIKGDESSMTYHTPQSGAYVETTAEVWFSTEEAAQQAGFSRAQS